MRITDTHYSGIGYDRTGARSRTVQRSEPAQDQVSFETSSGLTLPAMLALTAPGHPQRESFLTALSASLRAGLHMSDTPALASSMLNRGFDAVEQSDAGVAQ